VVDPSDIKQSLGALVSAGPVEIRENGARLASLEDFQYEVCAHGHSALLHLWGDGRTLTRRVLRIADRTTSLLLLEVECFGRSKPDRLEFSCGAFKPPIQLTREKFRERFADLLREQFPDEEIVSLTTSADLAHSLSTRYTRGIMRLRTENWAVLAAAPGESAAAIDDMLTFGLIWFRHSHTRVKSGRLAGLRLFLPEKMGEVIAHRARALANSITVEFYEISPATGRSRRVDPAEIGNVVTWLTARREVEGVLSESALQIEPIRKLAAEAITTSIVPGVREVALRFRGAEFARWQNGAIFFGLGDHRRLLTTETRPALKQLIVKLIACRHPAAKDTSHPLYRMQAERWLEAQVSADPSRVDARLDPRFLYAQVPASTAGDRGIVDLLGVTREGRLAILELKADEDIHLAMQAADYWLRVRRHQQQDDIQRYGYFPGIELRPEPPLLFLVAPAIRFHPATGTLLSYLSRDIEVARVGLAENWRRGLQVVLRQ